MISAFVEKKKKGWLIFWQIKYFWSITVRCYYRTLYGNRLALNTQLNRATKNNERSASVFGFAREVPNRRFYYFLIR